MRSDEFFARYGMLGLPEEIDIAFIDGSHACDDVRFDFMATLRRAHKDSYLLLHDSNIYVRELVTSRSRRGWRSCGC